VVESVSVLRARMPTFAVVYIVVRAYYCLIILQEFVIFRKQAKGCDEIGWQTEQPLTWSDCTSPLCTCIRVCSCAKL